MVEKLQIVSVRELMNQPVLVKAIQSADGGSIGDPPTEETLAQA
jgi:hypothetical protein